MTALQQQTFYLFFIPSPPKTEWWMEGKVSEGEDEEREISGVRAEQVVLNWQSRAKRKQQIHLCFCLWTAISLTSHSQESSAGCGPCSISGAKHKHLALLTAQVQINLILHDNWVIW